mgnify:CR=1 FL=1|jgi:rhamnosyltransferase
MKNNIIVLMSTFNGEKFIREQIESILAQENVNIKLLVRDDGSTDKTLDILNEYKNKGKLNYYIGKNLGPQLSFMHLLQNAPYCEYYAFADQDDVWLKDKLSTAIKKLEDNITKPALYFSQTQLTDKYLTPQKSVIINPLLTFGEALIYKFIGGCTMVMNHKLRDCISDKLPSKMPMHDIWIYTFAMAINAFIFFDRTPHILYRQHGNNTVGQGKGFIYEWKERFHHLISCPNERYNQARELYNCYKDIIPENNLNILETFLNGKNSFNKRIKILRNKEFRCANITTQVLFWIEVLLNKY